MNSLLKRKRELQGKDSNTQSVLDEETKAIEAEVNINAIIYYLCILV